MLKPVIYKDLEPGDKFNVAFPDKRIPNGFIDKTKTRVGITYTCFHDTRHFIAVLPSVSIINDALADYPYLNLFDVQEGVTPDMIKKYLKSDAPYKRIVTTPESFGKIITAAGKNTKWLYENFFLYLDEVHCYATEMFRNDILNPFAHVWKFKDMAMGSASPFPFSDPRIQALQHYKLRFKEKFGKITIIDDAKPVAALAYMIAKNMFPGNVHIFFNSVTEIGELIRSCNLKDVNIYCRDDERNMINLEAEMIHFRPRPIKEEYKKYNFYSCRYNEGWDLKDDETATIIIVTDVHKPHTLVGIPYKGFQAAGRMKVTPHKIYHITNNYGKKRIKSFDAIQRDWLYNAAKQIDYCNEHLGNCKRDGVQDNGLLRDLAMKFATLEKGNLVLSHMKVDQHICKEFCDQHYKSIEAIQQTWEEINYDTEVLRFDLAPVVKTKRSKEQINKQIIDRWEELNSHPEKYVYEVASTTKQKYQTDYPLLFEAYTILGPETLKRLNYNDTAMKEKLIEKSNSNIKAKIKIILSKEFVLNNRYPGKLIKKKLQEIYDEHGMKKENGTRKKAFAKDLEDFGFSLHPCKAENDKGEKVAGFEITRIDYSIQTAA